MERVKRIVLSLITIIIMWIKTPNEITRETYEKSIQAYIEWSPSDVTWLVKERYDTLLGLIKKNAKILELWSWPWRDANYIESLWYTVERSDFVDWFIKYMKSLGKEVLKIDALHFLFKNVYDVILANAVLLHFTKDEQEKIIQNVKNSLKEWWYFVVWVKNGIWNEYSSHKVNWDRFFQYRTKVEFIKTLENSWFQIIYSHVSDDQKWLHLICQK